MISFYRVNSNSSENVVALTSIAAHLPEHKYNVLRFDLQCDLVDLNLNHHYMKVYL